MISELLSQIAEEMLLWTLFKVVIGGKKKKSELENVLGNGDDDEMDNDVDEKKSTSPNPGTARRFSSPIDTVERFARRFSPPLNLVKRTASRYTVLLHAATPSIGISDSSCCRSGVMLDLTEGLKKVEALKNKQKCLHNVRVEKTKHLEIREKFGTEKKRLDMEEKQMMIKEKQIMVEEKIVMQKLALDKRKFAVKMGQVGQGLSTNQAIKVEDKSESDGNRMELDDNNGND